MNMDKPSPVLHLESFARLSKVLFFIENYNFQDTNEIMLEFKNKQVRSL